MTVKNNILVTVCRVRTLRLSAGVAVHGNNSGFISPHCQSRTDWLPCFNSLIAYTHSSNKMTSALKLLESLYFSLLSSGCNFTTFPILHHTSACIFIILTALTIVFFGSVPGSCHLLQRDLRLASVALL